MVPYNVLLILSVFEGMQHGSVIHIETLPYHITSDDINRLSDIINHKYRHIDVPYKDYREVKCSDLPMFEID